MTTMTTSRISNIVFSVYIALCFYVYGGSMINALVGYRTWRWIGANEFPKFHQVDTAHIIPIFVIFFFLSFIPQFLLFWFRPPVIPKWLVGLALIFNLINMISTITIQIPIQMQLDNAYSLALIERLISTDLIFRRTSISLLAIVNFVMLFKVVSSKASPDLSNDPGRAG
jgi:hypothetical protein